MAVIKAPELNPIQELIHRAKNQLKPVNIFCELTYRCNLDCVHCYCIRGAGRSELTLEQWKKVLKSSADEGGLYVTFSGGEILVHKHFFELYEYARELGFQVLLKTNATLITPDIADRIAAGYPKSIDVSVLGGDSRIHDRMTRVRASYEKAWEGIKLLRERNLNVKVNTSIMKDNYATYADVKSRAKGLGCAVNCDVTIYERNDGDKNVQNYSLDEEKYTEFASSVPVQNIGPKKLPDPNRQLMCNAGRGNFSINPYGDITTCNPMQLPLGNVLTDTWADVRKSQLLKRIVNMNLQDLPECRSCEYREFCSRCHATAFQETGSILQKSIQACKRAKLLKNVYNERLKQEKNNV